MKGLWSSNSTNFFFSLMSAQKAQMECKLFPEMYLITIKTSNKIQDNQNLLQNLSTMPRFYLFIYLLFCFIKFFSYHLPGCPQLSSPNIQKTLFNFCLYKARAIRFQVRPSDSHPLFPKAYMPKVQFNHMYPHISYRIAMLKRLLNALAKQRIQKE